MKNHYENEVNFQGHTLTVDGYIETGCSEDPFLVITIKQIYLSGTDIEISSGLRCDSYDELKEVVLEEIKKTYES